VKHKFSATVITLYSLFLYRGPDQVHYDLILDKDNAKLILRYLGEYAEEIRPKTAIPKQQDLLIYRVLKKRVRSNAFTPRREDIVLNICDLESIKVEKAKINESTVKITLVARDRKIELYGSIKIFKIAKKFAKTVAQLAKKNCGKL